MSQSNPTIHPKGDYNGQPHTTPKVSSPGGTTTGGAPASSPCPPVREQSYPGTDRVK